MLFNSYQFLIFFPIVVLIYWAIPLRFRYIWLLAASYYFYMCWNAKYALLLLFSTAVTYASGLIINKIKSLEIEEGKRTRYMKLCVAFSFVINIGVLAWFKYFNFIFENVQKVFVHIGIALSSPAFDIVLPVGISFYIFQALSYTVDVYRGDIYAEKNFLKYALFVSFFPQLVAGPIERSKNLLKQVAEPHRFDYEKCREGFLLMLWGFFLKLVIADRAAIIVNTVYNDYGSYPGMYLVVATVLFAFQIYCDFAGYSTIAMGAAKIMGFELMENFDCPYFAKSVSEFWRRWHISLSSWFRDYLYIPLGGNRKGTARKYLNMMIVFLTSGMWHGAQWSFIVWGGINGLYQIIGERLMPVRNKLNKLLRLKRESFGHKLFKVVTTFVLIDFAWIFFRANRFTDAFGIIKSMFSVRNWWVLFDDSLFTLGLDWKNFVLLILAIVILLVSDIFKYKGIKVRRVIMRQELWFRWSLYIAAIAGILVFGIWGPGYDASAFIYFQF